MKEFVCVIAENPEWATAVISLVGLILVLLQLKVSNLQLTLSNYSEYTRRYSELVAVFPEDVNAHDFVLESRKDRDDVMRAMRRYFDLSFEEYDLFKKKFIAPDIWAVWKSGIKTAMSKPAFQQAWEILKKDTDFGEDFERLIAELKP